MDLHDYKDVAENYDLYLGVKKGIVRLYKMMIHDIIFNYI